MSFCLILLAAGKSSRFNSNLAKPYHKIAGKTLIEMSLNKSAFFSQIKKTVIGDMGFADDTAIVGLEAEARTAEGILETTFTDW